MPLAPHHLRLRPSLPFLSLSLPTWSKAWPPPRAAHGRAAQPLDRVAVRLRPSLPRCSFHFHQIHYAVRYLMVVGTVAWDAGSVCQAHDPDSHKGVLASLVLGGVHLMDGGDGAATFGELHTTSSLHFASSKEMLQCAENACCKRMFQVFQMFQRYVAIVSYECCKSRLKCCICCNGCTHIL
jgi:hypothetical protein